MGHPPLAVKPEASGHLQHLKGLLLLRKIQHNSLKGYFHQGESSKSTAEEFHVDQGCNSAQSVLGIAASRTWTEMTEVSPHPVSVSPPRAPSCDWPVSASPF